MMNAMHTLYIVYSTELSICTKVVIILTTSYL